MIGSQITQWNTLEHNLCIIGSIQAPFQLFHVKYNVTLKWTCAIACLRKPFFRSWVKAYKIYKPPIIRDSSLSMTHHAVRCKQVIASESDVQPLIRFCGKCHATKIGAIYCLSNCAQIVCHAGSNTGWLVRWYGIWWVLVALKCRLLKQVMHSMLLSPQFDT